MHNIFYHDIKMILLETQTIFFISIMCFLHFFVFFLVFTMQVSYKSPCTKGTIFMDLPVLDKNYCKICDNIFTVNCELNNCWKLKYWHSNEKLAIDIFFIANPIQWPQIIYPPSPSGRNGLNATTCTFGFRKNQSTVKY